MTDRTPGFATLAIHAGAKPDPTTGARATPIYQTTSLVFEDVDQFASLFGLQTFGNIYGVSAIPRTPFWRSVWRPLKAAPRGSPSRQDMRRGRRHALPDEARGRIRCRQEAYGGSINQFNHAYKNFGWNVVWADPDDIGTFERAVSTKTRAIFIE